MAASKRREMVTDDIRDLLAAPDPGEAEQFLDRVDDTLTCGYAQALALEADRGRVERRIAELLSELAAGSGDVRAAELATLVQERATTEGHLVALRTLLASLRARRSEIKTAA
jgi:hypothetical protein